VLFFSFASAAVQQFSLFLTDNAGHSVVVGPLPDTASGGSVGGSFTVGTCTVSQISWSSTLIHGEAQLNPTVKLVCGAGPPVTFFVVASETSFTQPATNGASQENFAFNANSGTGTAQADVSISTSNVAFHLDPGSLAANLGAPIVKDGILLSATPSTGFTAPSSFNANSVKTAQVDVSTPFSITVASVFRCAGACTLTSAGNLGTVTGDPHFQGPHGEAFDFYGSSNEAYSLVSGPALAINMMLASDGVASHFISKLFVAFRNVTLLFDTGLHDANYLEAVNQQLAPVGAFATGSRYQTVLHICSNVFTITQRYTDDEFKKVLRINETVYYLDFTAAIAGCDNSYGGALGRLYRCDIPAPFQEKVSEDEYHLPHLRAVPKDLAARTCDSLGTKAKRSFLESEVRGFHA